MLRFLALLLLLPSLAFGGYFCADVSVDPVVLHPELTTRADCINAGYGWKFSPDEDANSAYDISVGGTNATTAAGARTALEITPANIGAEPTQTAASQVESEAGTEAAIRSFSPLRIFQAIAAKVAAMFTNKASLDKISESAGSPTWDGGAWPGGTGAVDSVFGRTAVVTAQTGDYTADQITQTATREFVTPAQKSKLDGIAAGAEVNVNADWNAVSGDAQILNKPTLGTAADNAEGDFATAAQGASADTAYGWGNHALAGYLTTETDDQTAAEVNITDTGTYYTGTTVEAALQEIGPTMTDTRAPTSHNNSAHSETYITGNQTITLSGDASGSGATAITVTVANDSHDHATAITGTAAALTANGTNCAAGSYPLGVDASGAVESCTDATTEIDSAISSHAGAADPHVGYALESAIVTTVGDPGSDTSIPSEQAVREAIAPGVTTTASSATPTPTGNSRENELFVTALAEAATVAAPSGTPANGNKLVIRIKDNGTARALAWNAIYRASTDLVLPTTTTLGKTLYLGFWYNSADSKWDLLAVLDNF